MKGSTKSVNRVSFVCRGAGWLHAASNRITPEKIEIVFIIGWLLSIAGKNTEKGIWRSRFL